MSWKAQAGIDPTLPETTALDGEVARAGRAFIGSAAVFDVENVSMFYGAFRAVRGVSLTIHKNEITAFIGPSGCGKTTVLRA